MTKKINNYKSEKIGVYKDENSKTFSVNPHFTHEGCLIE